MNSFASPLAVWLLTLTSVRHVDGFINPSTTPPDAFVGHRYTLLKNPSINSVSTSPMIRTPTIAFAKEDDNEGDEEGWSFGDQPNLGINIGQQLNPLTPEQAAELKEEATQTINEAFGERIDEIASLKEQVRQDFARTKENLRYASDKRTKEQTEKLMGKIDRLSGDFLESTKETRIGTKLAASADQNMVGKGIDIGSWGKIGGLDVLTTSSGGMSVGLLGSVGAASATSNMGLDGDGEVAVADDNKILIICDEKQDPNMQKVLDKFTSLLSDTFTDEQSIQVDTYKPTATLPMGGNSAQCAIIVASSLSNGKSSAEAIFSRIMKRTVAPGGGKVAKPPSHLVVISSVGSERTDKFPYSMQNMMGGKLGKQRDIEESTMSIVKGGTISDSLNQVSLDYTILKLGELASDDKVKESLQIMPGDTLDGKVGINAAANALLQAVALRATARNATLSVVGGIEETLEESSWEDWFLRLNGPELWRMEDVYTPGAADVDVDRKFGELTAFLEEWSLRFDNGAKGTGLTTPVRVSRSDAKLNQSTSTIESSWGVRLEFKQTMTGSSYKSKDEEREFERQQPSSSNGPNKKVVVKTTKQKKEGGVEVIAEKVANVDGSIYFRVRARRCNLDDSTVIKEMSEETILKRLEEAIAVWKRES